MNVLVKQVSLVLVAALSLSVADAYAQQRKKTVGKPTKNNVRCEDDSLTNEQALKRVKWAEDNSVLPEQDLFEMVVMATKGGMKQRDRVQYPMFVVWNGNPDQAILWRPEDHNWPKKLPNNVEWLAVCTASCYTSDQQLLTGRGYMPIEEAESLQVSEIITIKPGSGIGRVSTTSSKLGRYTKSLRDTDHKILHFQTAGGGSISVTLGHVLVDSRGTLKVASDFKVGDGLLTEDGQPDAIVSIEREDYFGSVYNVRPESLSQEENLVIVQGFINGSDRFQNDWANSIGKEIMIDEIPSNLFK